MESRDLKLLFAVLAIGAAALAAWHLRDRFLPRPEPQVAAPPEPAIAEEPEEAGPRHPVAPVEITDSATGKLVTLPPLDDSDAYFLLALVDVFGADVEALLVKEALIDKVVATVDNLPRDYLAEKMRPAGRLPEPFRADAAPGEEQIYLSPDSYRRYDPLVNQVASADLDELVDMYRRFYPLFQESYRRLGYPDGYFNDRVIEVIDHLLATPQPAEPVRLVRPHVLYEYADPALEELSSGQKLLIRMGGDHATTLKRVLRELRAQLAQ